MQKYNKNNAGFTLLELAIVMLIIGLIVVGIIAGQSVIRNAKLKSVIMDIKGYRTALSEFKEFYGGLPGDLVNATSFWSGAGQTANGNGNNFIELGGEDLLAWQHLVLGQLVEGDFTGTLNAGNMEIDVNIPSASIKGAGYRMGHNTGNPIYGRTANHVQIGGVNGAELDLSILTSLESRAIDEKADDGAADTGAIRAVTGTSPSGTCVTVGNSYDLDNEGLACITYFFME